jgi:hypothetical protein
MYLTIILLLFMAVVGLFEGARLAKATLLFDDPVGPGWYLFFMSGLLLVCGLALLARRIRGKAVSQRVSLSVLKGPAGQSLLLLLFYTLAVFLFGYLIASLFFFILAQRSFGEQSWIRGAGVGAAITGGFYFVFSYLAGVPFP